MRKSEGNKRREVSEENTRDIVRLYSDGEEGKKSKVFDSTAFGYRRVRIMRPLRTKMVMAREGLARLEDEKAWEKRTEAQRTAWADVLETQIGTEQD